MFDLDHRLREMDRKRIDTRVLSLSAPNVNDWDAAGQVRIARHVNDATARICRVHPDRFVGLASLPLKDVEASLAEIDRARQELDMVGVMIGSNVDGMGEFELPLRVGLMFDTTLAATRMINAGIFERCPDFPYIMAHTGGTLLMIVERLDNGYRLFPDCRQFISKLPSAYAKKL